MVFEIRNLTKADLPVCAKLLLQEFNRIGEHWTPAMAKSRIFEVFERNPTLCFGLVLDEKIIGMLLGKPFTKQNSKCLYLMNFAIDLKHQGKGFGLKALFFIEKFAKEKGFKALMLDRNKNKNAIKIYKKFGFEKTDYVLMEKKM